MIWIDPLPRLRGRLFALSEAICPCLEVAKTPSEVIDEDEGSNFRLVRYWRSSTHSGGHAILLVPHIINRPYILDLNHDVSVVRGLGERGFDVYLIDWGYPEIEQRRTSLADYAHYVDRSMDLVGQDKVSLLGYCTGGVISLIYASLHPERVNRLVMVLPLVEEITSKLAPFGWLPSGRGCHSLCGGPGARLGRGACSVPSGRISGEPGRVLVVRPPKEKEDDSTTTGN